MKNIYPFCQPLSYIEIINLNQPSRALELAGSMEEAALAETFLGAKIEYNREWVPY